MSAPLAAVRIAVKAIASYSVDEQARHLAMEALEALDAFEASLLGGAPTAYRRTPLTNAEKCARRRLRAKGIEPPPLRPPRHRSDTENDTDATPNDTKTTPRDTADGVAPSRALPLKSPPRFNTDLGSISLSSLGSLSPPESLLTEGSSGSTRAREGRCNSAGEGVPAAAESLDRAAPLALMPTVATPRDTVATPKATPRDTENDTARHRRDTKGDTKIDTGVSRPIPADWQPAPETVAWCEAQGVDARAATSEFVEYWLDRAQNRRDQRARKVSWERTFKKNIERLLELGKAPMLPEPPPAAAPAANAERARAVGDVIAGLSRSRAVLAKEGNVNG